MIRALILVSAAVVKKSVVSPRDLQVFVSESQTTSIQIPFASRGPNDNRTGEQSNSHLFFLKYGTKIACRKNHRAQTNMGRGYFKEER